jgi:AbrB family looped-hinge helix DNA binding protein
MAVVISEKGWVVIPAELRRKYALKPGSTVQIVDYGAC